MSLSLHSQADFPKDHSFAKDFCVWVAAYEELGRFNLSQKDPPVARKCFS